MTNMVVFGVPAAIVIVALVEILKKFGLVDGEWAIAASIAIGISLSVLTHVAAIVPGFEIWYECVFTGLLAGLAACGLYDGKKAVIPNN